MSTHIGLVARQWGADKVTYAGDRDSNLLESIRSTSNQWGGETEYDLTEEWKKKIKDFEGLKIHLTMYGLPLRSEEQEIKAEAEDQDVLIIVGSQKVPSWVYRNVDLNIGVGNQPHSEVAALSVFMDRIFGIKEEFENADKKVSPSNGKKIVEDA